MIIYFILVTCPIFANFTQQINVGKSKYVRGVTVLRDNIYVLCRPSAKVINVCLTRNSSQPQMEMEIPGVKSPVDVESSEKETCLYVSDFLQKCIWKITRNTDGRPNIIQWLTLDYHPSTLSVSSDDQLLMVNATLSILNIYGSDTQLILSIRLSEDFRNPRHAVETSTGNFIISHQWMEHKKEVNVLSG